jgi:hypothetical protein
MTVLQLLTSHTNNNSIQFSFIYVQTEQPQRPITKLARVHRKNNNKQFKTEYKIKQFTYYNNNSIKYQ